MKKLLAILSLSVSFNLMAADLLCDISVNQDILSESTVTTVLNQKTSIDSVDGVVAYVTEKEKNHYVVEAYLAQYDLRIYGEGTIKDNDDRLVASVWGRDSMIDIECRLSTSLRK